MSFFDVSVVCSDVGFSGFESGMGLYESIETHPGMHFVDVSIQDSFIDGPVLPPTMYVAAKRPNDDHNMELNSSAKKDKDAAPFGALAPHGDVFRSIANQAELF